jgi:ketosteroid isomerase-like protein
MLEVCAVDTVRRYFEIWHSRNRAAMEAALTETFSFTSPLDDHIDKRTFFERCWPNADKIHFVELEDIVAHGERVFVRYTAYRTADGTRFRNTEAITLRHGKIDEVDVYFGRDLDVRHDNGEEAAIRKQLDQKIEALREKDLARQSALYAPYACTFDLAPPLANTASPSERKEALAIWFAGWRGPIHLEMRDLEVHVSGDLAVAHALERMAGTKETGETPDFWFRQTTVFRKIEDHWVITHEHSSTPFDMKTLAAALDLKP